MYCLLFEGINFFVWVEHKVSLVPTYVCIILVSFSFKYVLFYFPTYRVITFHL